MTRTVKDNWKGFYRQKRKMRLIVGQLLNDMVKLFIEL